MEFSKEEYWSGLSCPSPVLRLLHWQPGSLPLVPPGKPKPPYISPYFQLPALIINSSAPIPSVSPTGPEGRRHTSEFTPFLCSRTLHGSLLLSESQSNPQGPAASAPQAALIQPPWPQGLRQKHTPPGSFHSWLLILLLSAQGSPPEVPLLTESCLSKPVDTKEGSGLG